MSTTLNHTDAEIRIEALPGGMKRVKVVPHKNLFMPRDSWQTSYPLSLIRLILEVKGPAYLCDEMAREEDAEYVRRDLETDLMAYFDVSDFENKRSLDFGCGSGASSMILHRLFPQTEIVGVELDETLLRVARARAAHYQCTNVKLLQSPAGSELPVGIGKFAWVILSAVYEHLLPDERLMIIPKIWDAIIDDGYLFLNMTPHRYFPIEHHTTGLPLINYMPDRLALAAARTFSKRIDKTEPWQTLLRRGIRGGTEREILSILEREGAAQHPVLLEPSKQGLRDRIDLWYSALNQTRLIALKRLLKASIKGFKLISGMTLVPNLSLVIQKTRTQSIL
jgi:SAM-dependent methyltransferase